MDKVFFLIPYVCLYTFVSYDKDNINGFRFQIYFNNLQFQPLYLFY